MLVLLLAPPAAATSLAIPRPALCAQADLVVVGEVTGTEGRWGGEGEVPVVTHADIAVIRVVHGAAPAALVVVTPGGRVAGLGLTVSEAPALRADARYLLLLSSGPNGYTVVGGHDGAVPLGWDGASEAAALASLGSCRA